MGIENFNNPTSEEIKKNMNERVVSDARLIEEGASYEVQKNGDFALELTQEQIDKLKNLHEQNLDEINFETWKKVKEQVLHWYHNELKQKVRWETKERGHSTSWKSEADKLTQEIKEIEKETDVGKKIIFEQIMRDKKDMLSK